MCGSVVTDNWVSGGEPHLVVQSALVQYIYMYMYMYVYIYTCVGPGNT